MPGKNQQKRINKSRAHARMVWEREQLHAAKAKKTIDEAMELVVSKKTELTDEQFAEIEKEVARRYADIEAFLLKARDKYVAKVGAENAYLN